MATLGVIPPYGKRQGWVPKDASDFGNGGAFPEISLLQYPLGLGEEGQRKSQSSKALVLQTDAQGRPTYEAILTQNSSRSITFSRPEHYRPKWSDAADLQKPSEEEQARIAEETAKALGEISKVKQSMNQLTRAADSIKKKDQFIRYMPDTAAPGYTPNCAERIIRVVEKKIDPLEPSKFRVRRAPAGSFEPPPPLLRAPAKKLTAEDHAAWNLPPCVSNWKNQKGYTIPLDMRLQADGRGLEEVSINSKFAQFSEALYVAERLAREEIRLKNDLLKQKKQLEEAQREEMLREIAAKARQERVQRLAVHQGDAPPVVSPKQSRSPSPSSTQHVKRSRSNSQDQTPLGRGDHLKGKESECSPLQKRNGGLPSAAETRRPQSRASPSPPHRRQISPPRGRSPEVKELETSAEDNLPPSRRHRRHSESPDDRRPVTTFHRDHKGTSHHQEGNVSMLADRSKFANRSPSPSSSTKGGSTKGRGLGSLQERRNFPFPEERRRDTDTDRRRPLSPGRRPSSPRRRPSSPRRRPSSPRRPPLSPEKNEYPPLDRRRQWSPEKRRQSSPERRYGNNRQEGASYSPERCQSLTYRRRDLNSDSYERRFAGDRDENGRNASARYRHYEDGSHHDGGTHYERREREMSRYDGRGRSTEYDNGFRRSNIPTRPGGESDRRYRDNRRDSASLSDEEIPSTHQVDERGRRRRRSSSSEESRSSKRLVVKEQERNVDSLRDGHVSSAVKSYQDVSLSGEPRDAEGPAAEGRAAEGEGESSPAASKRRRAPSTRETSHRPSEEANPLQVKVKQLERERRKEIEREFRLERAGRKRVRTDADRDVSERIALGQAQATSQDAMYDTRLFNREGDGPDITVADEDDYALYDRPLFADKSESASGLYRMDKERIRKNVGLRTVTAIGDRAEGRGDQPVKFEKAEPGAR